MLAAAKKEREFLPVDEFSEGREGRIEILKLEFPPPREGAEIIKGDLDEVVENIFEILKEKGVR